MYNDSTGTTEFQTCCLKVLAALKSLPEYDAQIGDGQDWKGLQCLTYRVHWWTTGYTSFSLFKECIISFPMAWVEAAQNQTIMEDVKVDCFSTAWGRLSFFSCHGEKNNLCEASFVVQVMLSSHLWQYQEISSRRVVSL